MVYWDLDHFHAMIVTGPLGLWGNQKLQPYDSHLQFTRVRDGKSNVLLLLCLSLSPTLKVYFESYLESLPYSERNIFTKFRIGVHNLEIEKGRHKNLPEHKHICTLCNCEVEDEYRDTLFNEMYKT